MRVLLFGKYGQLGWELHRSLITLGDLTAIDYPDVDFNQPDTLPEIIQSIRPDVIVNAVAYTNVDKAESEPEITRRVNADAVGEIAKAAAELNALLIHFSTDYVFDGRKGSPYVETDPPNPLNVYGKMKLEGEEAITESGCLSWIFRIAWLYSSRQSNFVLKVLELIQSSKEIKIVTDQISNPTWARSVAQAVSLALATSAREEPGWLSNSGGIYHLTGGFCSRYEWVKNIIETMMKKTGTQGPKILPAQSIDFPLPATRPLFSALESDKYLSRFGFRMPDWRICTAFVVDELVPAHSKSPKKTPDDNFEEGVRNYLKPYEENFNYDNMLRGHLDISRFYLWVEQINGYKQVCGSRILSSECGSGGDLYAFAERGAASVVGIEVDFRLAKLALLRMKQSKYSNKSFLIDYNGGALPLKSNSIDIVLSLHVLEHTNNPLNYLQELVRILAPNGILFLDLPSRYYLYEQHTQLRYIHYLPMRLRNLIIKQILLHTSQAKKDLRYKLETLINFNFLAPGQILNIFREISSVRVIDSYLHSYSTAKIHYPQKLGRLIFNNFTGMTTYRLVIQKG